MPLDRLALSPQCGFASTLPGNKVTEADQRAKLELVGRVARDVWGSGFSAAAERRATGVHVRAPRLWPEDRVRGTGCGLTDIGACLSQ